MEFRPGPHRAFASDQPASAETPTAGSAPRYYGCPNYNTCLSISAALDWEAFSCCGCSAEVDEALVWQARQAQRKDPVAKKICKIPQGSYVEGGAKKQQSGMEAKLHKVRMLKRQYLGS